MRPLAELVALLQQCSGVVQGAVTSLLGVVGSNPLAKVLRYDELNFSRLLILYINHSNTGVVDPFGLDIFVTEVPIEALNDCGLSFKNNKGLNPVQLLQDSNSRSATSAQTCMHTFLGVCFTTQIPSFVPHVWQWNIKLLPF